MTLREALRTLRRVARSGRDAVEDVSRQAGGPVSAVAGVALSGADRFAAVLEGATARLVGAPGRDRFARPDPGASARAVSEAAYAALRRLQTPLGVRDAFLSELALRAAAPDLAGTPASAAGAIRDLEGLAVSDVEMADGAEIEAEAAPRVMLFALALWLLSDRVEGEAETGLEAAALVAAALASEIAEAQTPVALARLLDEFRHHV